MSGLRLQFQGQDKTGVEKYSLEVENGLFSLYIKDGSIKASLLRSYNKETSNKLIIYGKRPYLKNKLKGKLKKHE